MNEPTTTPDNKAIWQNHPLDQSNQTTLILSKPVRKESNDDKKNLTSNDLNLSVDGKSWLINIPWMDVDAKEGGWKNKRRYWLPS